jgi:large subunit ribosomal protein L23
MSEFHKILMKPLVTEKSMQSLQESNRVSFKVKRDANKIQVRTAVEQIFEVTVESVNMVTVRGKKKKFGRSVGQSKDWKKAIVKLKEGDKIELFEGV